MPARDKVYVDIVTDTKKQTSELKNFATGLLSIGAATAALQKTVQVTKEAVALFKEQEQVEAKLNATLKSTGFAAGLTADRITDMASALQSQTTFGDEAIIGAQSLLLTFKEVGEQVFPRATEAILDMSAAMGQDLRSTTVQVGKALNDPIQGVTALRRVGVQLTGAQEEMIEKFVEVNDVAAAQEIILQELESQFGGVAKAAGETATGAMEQFKNAIGDGKEAQGEFAAYVAKDTVKALTDLTSRHNELKSSILDVGTALAKISSGQDAGDLTNELETQLAVVKSIENGLLSRLGLGENRLKQEQEKLLILHEQQQAYEEQVERAKELSEQAKREAEWKSVLSGIEERRAVKSQELKEATEEANQIIFDSLDPLEQQRISLNEQAKALNEIYQKNLQRRDLAGEEKALHEEQLARLRTAIGLVNQEYLAVVAKQEAQKESNETDVVHEQTMAELQGERWLKEEEHHNAKMERIALEKEAEIAAEEEKAKYIEETQARLLEQEKARQKQLQEIQQTTFEQAQGFANALISLSQAKTNKEIQDIKNSEMAEEEKQKKIAQLQREQAIAQRAVASFNAAVSGAQAIITAYAQLGPIAGSIAAIGVAATTAAQIAAINSEPLPEIPSAATGANFIATRPQLLQVGDNPYQAEEVSVTPLGSDNRNGPGGTRIIVNLDKQVLMDAIGRASRNGEIIIDSRAVR